ncbi:MAG: DJ-1/PfpI family protein [Moorea sp. SIOASIH]|uniref:DJ-1/PfpI family protein n=1 Tax=Moorena sp. SIOASIH TaxID=2607817 RepID=UPI0013BD139A|nr:DJ-1/PfpI family protein [Moorena sp. SIOASIH]NEO38994.1 DJ-1/PfpI family protein [Moorena sp. SIOASIH]
MLIQSLIYHDFTLIDLVGALQPLAMIPGAKTEFVAKVEGPISTDSGVVMVANRNFKNASQQPDVLLVPGGGKPSIDILEDKESIDFVALQGERAGWLVGVCTGPLLLAKAGLLKGYRAAAHWAVIDTLDAFGAIPVHERVVIDRNRCTGGGMTAGVDIGLTMVGQLAGKELGQMTEMILEYNPEPPFKTGHPTISDRATIEKAKQMFESIAPEDRIRSIAATE